MFFLKKNIYRVIQNPDKKNLEKKYSKVWKDKDFPLKQWGRVEKQLRNIYGIPEFKAIINCVKSTGIKRPSILEIGCSSGYLGEVFRLSHIKAKYEGTDYSPAFVNFAKQKFPENKFTVNDAAKLNYISNSFDIVISGCCLLHIINYRKAISEAARVAKKYVIFHRTPVFSFQPTTFFAKTAYGAEMLEIHFNEEELVGLFYKSKLAIIKILTVGNSSGNMQIKNYVCKKF